jgi:all-trans-retinol dehydrogenase (NAD+)
MTSFSGHTVLITGAANGIGRLLAQLAAAKGAFVVAWDIDEGGLKALEAQMAGRVAAYQVDMSEKTAVQNTAARVIAEHGHVDILINNAGIVHGKPILENSDDAIERTFDVNILAHFWTVRAFLPGMIERGHGHIVTIASAGGLAAAPRMADYTASKFAAVGFDEALRVEFKRLGIPVQTTAVCPYYIDTGMFSGVKTRFPWLLPILDPDDVARRTIRAIEKDHARLIMPPFVYGLFPLRLLPVNLFDQITKFFGISSSMDKFLGRNQ